MPDSLLKPIDNLTEEFKQNKYKDQINNCLKCIKKDSCKIKYNDCKCYLEYVEDKKYTEI